MKTWRKVQTQMERHFKNLELVLDYFVEQLTDDGRPPDVIKAFCELYWPNRTFTVDEEDELATLGNAVDDKTGETADALYRKERRERMVKHKAAAVEPCRASGDC
jgi:hypothetical protein